MLRLPAGPIRATIAAGLIAGAALVAPTAASAKTFVANVTDPAGDASNDAFDITSARVAYNRRTGAISAHIVFNGSVSTTSTNTVVVVMSDLVGGKCQKASIGIGAEFAKPDLAIGGKWTNGAFGKPLYAGSGSTSDSAVSLRVKAKSLSGRTVGCAVVAVTSGDRLANPKIYDITASNTGFSS